MRKLLCKIPFLKDQLTKNPIVNVIPLSGIIMAKSGRNASINLNDYDDLIKDAFTYTGTSAVVLLINSPGGSPAQSDLIGQRIVALSKEYKIPVYSFVEDVAASGGYWLACAGEKIYALNSSIVGSIGVISASFGFHKVIEKYDIERRVHTSGHDKSFLDPFQEEKAKDVKRLKDLQHDIHQDFIDWVKSRRGDRLKGEDKDLFEGAFWVGKKAVELGIIDEIGTLHDIMKEQFGDKVKIRMLEREKGLIPSLLGVEVSPSLKSINESQLWANFGIQK